MRTVFRIFLVAVLGALALILALPVTAEELPGVKPGDDAMTCAQIAAELAPYAQQMSGSVNPLVQTQSELVARGQRQVAEAAPAVASFAAAATATHLDPTGMSSRALGQAEVGYQQAQWNKALAEDKPLMDKENQQLNDMMKQAMAMQANARLQRLMQLAQQKNCH
jgi:hypothetical protein